MTRDFLKNLNLDQEVVDKIMSEYGKSVDGIKKSGETELAKIKAINVELSQQIDTYKDYNELKGFKEKYDELKTQYDKDTNALKLDNAVDKSLLGAKVKNLNIVKKSLDLTGVSFDKDGKLVGLTEQIDKLKETDSYLFDNEKQKPIDGEGLGLGVKSNLTPLSGVEEEFYKRNPDLRKEV